MLARLGSSIRQLFPFTIFPIFNRIHSLQRLLPRSSSSVAGFTVRVTREKGCVLHTHQKGSPDTVPGEAAAVDEHFKVEVSYDGSNPLYPDTKGPWTRLLTNTLSSDSGYGLSGGVSFERPGTTFKKVEIIESYEDWRDADVIGRRPRPMYVVWLAITTQQSSGFVGTSKFGIADRPA